MAGIYIHIPFCRKACTYCDFHFSTKQNYMDDMVKAICQEAVLRSNYLNQKVETVYFGGGTPSLLNADQLNKIVKTLNQNFDLAQHLEVTLEANPEDLTFEKLHSFRQTLINRLSIGVQSLNNDILRFFNRNHNADLALKSIQLAQNEGFKNINVDFIFGIPKLSLCNFFKDVQKIIALNIPHLSVYGLTVEPQTALYHQKQTKQFLPLDDEIFAEHYKKLVYFLKKHDYEAYEISNYARNQSYAQHNTNYWKHKPYLGLGPSAHSYNGHSRQVNVSNNKLYIKNLTKKKLPCQIEYLSKNQKINEYLLTALRTKWGYDNRIAKKNYGYDIFKKQPKKIENFQKQGLLKVENEMLTLTLEGKLLADTITESFFVIGN